MKGIKILKVFYHRVPYPELKLPFTPHFSKRVQALFLSFICVCFRISFLFKVKKKNFLICNVIIIVIEFLVFQAPRPSQSACPLLGKQEIRPKNRGVGGGILKV